MSRWPRHRTRSSPESGATWPRRARRWPASAPATSAAAVQDAYLPAVVLGLYERQVLDAPTWPFNPAIVGRVFASAVAPLGVYVLKLAFGVGSGL